MLLRQRKVAHHSKMVAAVTDAHPAQAAGQHHLRGRQQMQWRDLRVLTPCLRTPQQLRCLFTGKDIGLIKLQLTKAQSKHRLNRAFTEETQGCEAAGHRRSMRANACAASDLSRRAGLAAKQNT